MREAQKARDNRAEIVKALSIGQITRRDLFRWGIYTATGALALKNGLSPFAPSALADDIPTGTPRSPLGSATKFSQPMPRLALQTPRPLTRDAATGNAVWPAALGERPSKRLSWHTGVHRLEQHPPRLSQQRQSVPQSAQQARPDGGPAARRSLRHQRWDEFFPKVGYVMTLGPGRGRHQIPSRHYGAEAERDLDLRHGRFVRGTLPPFLIKGRYGEPILTAHLQQHAGRREENGGFGRNETQLHLHNAHNGAESDGAANVHHFPGTFYDYRWSTTLARRDTINTQATDDARPARTATAASSGCPATGASCRARCGRMITASSSRAENVYKGNLGMVNYYRGRTAATRQWSTASTCACRAAGCSTGATSTST